MAIKLTNAQLWVRDQDEALDFYTRKVGWEVRSNITMPEMGNFRWLAVGPKGQPDISVVLMAIPGPPVMDTETAKQVKDLTAKGFAGNAVPHDRRYPGRLQGAILARRRVCRETRAAAVRDRWSLP